MEPRNIVVLSLVPLLLSAVARVACESLYAANGDVLELRGEAEFSSALYRSSSVWLVEFYASTCGHCRQYAPIYSAHATDVKAWTPVAKVASVNCADDSNLGLCSAHKISSVPDIRLFPIHQGNTTSDGRLFTGIPLHGDGSKSESADKSSYLRQRMIDVIKDQAVKPSTWPSLQFDGKHPAELTFDKASKFGIVFQESKSYLGAELSLDLLVCPSVKVHIVTDDETIGRHNVRTLPSLLAWNGEQKNLLSDCSRDGARDLLLSLCGRVHHAAEYGTVGADEPAAAAAVVAQSVQSKAAPGIYMTDIVSALASIIHHEVPLHSVIHGSSLEALSQFLQTVHYCLPLPTEVRQFVVNLLRQLKLQKHSRTLSSVTWARMKAMQSPSASLPHKIRWVGCAGSVPGKRGFPCGLWTLFHTMTSHCSLLADGELLQGISTDNHVLMRRRVAGVDGRFAVLAIRDYIEHFFSCGDCRAHFLEMSQNIKHEVRSNHEAVMWLWSAHNKVNQRLAKDTTVDPAYPKAQFPSEGLCSECRKSSLFRDAASHDAAVLWEESSVLTFLFHFYGPTGVHWSDNGQSWAEPKATSPVS
ncbi:sulfhydryl oxidase 1-like [Sycon ciliatum]|uniref:sulfhydryl oxidase 1-like n=1 Tax=Sycon ciliatum TaxID=27933 RepID=UPI0031F6B483